MRLPSHDPGQRGVNAVAEEVPLHLHAVPLTGCAADCFGTHWVARLICSQPRETAQRGWYWGCISLSSRVLIGPTEAQRHRGGQRLMSPRDTHAGCLLLQWMFYLFCTLCHACSLPDGATVHALLSLGFRRACPPRSGVGQSWRKSGVWVTCAAADNFLSDLESTLTTGDVLYAALFASGLASAWRPRRAWRNKTLNSALLIYIDIWCSACALGYRLMRVVFAATQRRLVSVE